MSIYVGHSSQGIIPGYYDVVSLSTDSPWSMAFMIVVKSLLIRNADLLYCGSTATYLVDVLFSFVYTGVKKLPSIKTRMIYFLF